MHWLFCDPLLNPGWGLARQTEVILRSDASSSFFHGVSFYLVVLFEYCASGLFRVFRGFLVSCQSAVLGEHFHRQEIFVNFQRITNLVSKAHIIVEADLGYPSECLAVHVLGRMSPREPDELARDAVVKLGVLMACLRPVCEGCVCNAGFLDCFRARQNDTAVLLVAILRSSTHERMLWARCLAFLHVVMPGLVGGMLEEFSTFNAFEAVRNFVVIVAVHLVWAT